MKDPKLQFFLFNFDCKDVFLFRNLTLINHIRNPHIVFVMVVNLYIHVVVGGNIAFCPGVVCPEGFVGSFNIAIRIVIAACCATIISYRTIFYKLIFSY